MQEYRDYYGPDAGRPTALGFTPAVRALLVSNVAIFLVSVVVAHRFWPDLFRYFGLVPRRALGEGWIWQFFTYPFLHSTADALHLLFNVISLYFFGREIESLYGTRRFLVLYFAAACAGGLLHCAIEWGSGLPVVGASGAVYGVMVVYALHYPRQKILFFFILPMEMWLLVALLIAFNTAFYAAGASGTAYLAHFGGAVFGYAFWRLRAPFESYFERVAHRMAERENARGEELEARLDSVLEKINREGMGSLSKKEWEVLKRASRHYQRRP